MDVPLTSKAVQSAGAHAISKREEEDFVRIHN
jgi:hypothetical protein